MEILLRSVGPGVHCYSPFLKCPVRGSVQNLDELCKNVILKCVTLRRLASSVVQLPLPKRLLRYITDLTTTDFEQIECAPFSDAFSFNFFHRALTYRVMCLRDGQEYMIAYGYSPVEHDKLKTGHEEWVRIQHKNIMCVCATVRDPCTDNIFYVYDQPFASLEQMWSVFFAKNYHVPVAFFARLTTDVCEALQYIISNGLRYNNFGLDNIFITDDRLVLENGLMRKSIKFTTDRIQNDCDDERRAICDVGKVLKLLLHCCGDRVSYSDGLRNLIRDVEHQDTIDNVLQIVNDSVENISAFSFIRLIQNLQNLLMEDK